MHTSFTSNFKLKVVKYAEQFSVSRASSHFKIDRQNIRQWKKQKSELEGLIRLHGSKRKRREGGGRKLLCLEMELELAEWVKFEREQGHRVSSKRIMKQALEHYKVYNDQDSQGFNASSEWLAKFMRRNNFSLHRRTSVAQKDPDQVCEKFASFVIYNSDIRRKNGIDDAHVLGMDETAVYIDMVADTTADTVGTKTVTLKSTGHEKLHVTVVLSACGDGRKLKPMVILLTELIVEWVKEAWSSLSTDLIKRSFKACGQTTATDGSEDDQISCMKNGEPCRDAWQMLQNYRDENLDGYIQIDAQEDEPIMIDMSSDEESGDEEEGESDDAMQPSAFSDSD